MYVGPKHSIVEIIQSAKVTEVDNDDAIILVVLSGFILVGLLLPIAGKGRGGIVIVVIANESMERALPQMMQCKTLCAGSDAECDVLLKYWHLGKIYIQLEYLKEILKMD